MKQGRTASTTERGGGDKLAEISYWRATFWGLHNAGSPGRHDSPGSERLRTGAEPTAPARVERAGKQRICGGPARSVGEPCQDGEQRSMGLVGGDGGGGAIAASPPFRALPLPLRCSRLHLHHRRHPLPAPHSRAVFVSTRRLALRPAQDSYITAGKHSIRRATDHGFTRPRDARCCVRSSASLARVSCCSLAPMP